MTPLMPSPGMRNDAMFSMLMAEFATAVKWRLSIKVVVVKNDVRRPRQRPSPEESRPARKYLAGERCELTLTAVNRTGRQIRVRVECTPMNPAGQAIEGVIILMDEPESRE